MRGRHAAVSVLVAWEAAARALRKRPFRSIAVRLALGFTATIAVACLGALAGLSISANDARTDPPESSANRHHAIWESPVVTRVIATSANEPLASTLEMLRGATGSWYDNQTAGMSDIERATAERMPSPEVHAHFDRKWTLFTIGSPHAWGQTPRPNECIDLKLPHWYRSHLGYGEDDHAFWALQVTDAAGWPFRAFECTLIVANLTNTRPYFAERVMGGITMQRAATVWGAKSTTAETFWSDWRVIPYRAIWLGLIGDSLAWALIISALLAICAASRAVHRHVLGRCIRCGYSRVLSGRCPECGQVVLTDGSPRDVELL